ncbi:TonB-dependent receptor [Azorhizobium oxalatiphilum]|nr:TonB-dependent receptor [Azorhizobium oxalatiphilum]
MRGVSVVAVASMLATPGLAQEVIELSDVIVTGEKVERTLTQTASSVSVFTANDIANSFGDPTVRDVIEGTPNVVFPGPVSAPIIRGQDTIGPNTGSIAFLSGTVPRATINVDGHYQNWYEYVFGGVPSWDVKSIEVFRGPQTTSQGANAIAGTIIVNTKDPTFTPEMLYQAEYGSYNTNRASIALSGPFNDQLAGRIAVDYYGRDTFINYINPAFHPGESDQDYASLMVRGKLLWRPTTIPGLEAKLTYSYLDTNRPTDEAAFPSYADLNSRSLTMPSWDQTTNTGILDVSYDFGNGIKLVNQAQYSDSDIARINDPMTDAGASINQTNISNETRLLFGEASNKISGLAGLYYANTTSDEVLYYRGISSFDDTKDNLGIFGELSYRLTDRWTVTGSLRYQQDHVQRTGTSSLARVPINYDETFDAWLPKITLAYALTEEITVGGLISKGYNPGGVSLNVSTGQWIPFEAESVWDYELFTRMNFLDGRLFITGNLFYMDYQDAQRYVNVLLSSGLTQTYTVNADAANAFGFELSASYKVLSNLLVTAGWGVTQSEITSMGSNPAYVGNEFQKSPGYTVDFGAVWEPIERLSVAGKLRFVDGYYSDDANTVAYQTNSYMIADASVAYKFNQHFEVYGYAKNLFNERSPTYMQLNRSLGSVEASMTIPQIFGVGMRGQF